MSQNTNQGGQENLTESGHRDARSRRPPRQSIRQTARRQAREASARHRQEHAQQQKRLQGHAEAVLTALGEREALIARTEREAGKALTTMTRAEGLSLREAVDWCGSALSVREATRLRRLAEIPEVSDATGASDDPGDDLGDD